MSTFRSSAINFLSNFDSSVFDHIDKPYLKASITYDYWKNFLIPTLEKEGIDRLSFDANILDIGTQFGVMPAMLKHHGFQNIDCTDVTVQFNETFKYIWNQLDISPFEFLVEPNKTFDLPKQYDFIMCTTSNIFWKYTGKIYRWDHENRTVEKRLHDNNGFHYFIPWELDEIKLFVDNIKVFLKPGGKAIINIEPFVYLNGQFNEVTDYLNPIESDTPYQAYFVIEK